jgi:hypothetical protein
MCAGKPPPRSTSPRRRFVLVLALTAVGTGVARADQAKVACVHDAEEGQRLRAQGKLREAREAFTACAADRCPAVVRSDCSGWLVEAEAALPTVVVRASAVEEAARELYEVAVRVDGVLLTEKLDGRDLPVNPGERHFAFAAEGRVPTEEDVVIRVGEKHRLLAVSLRSTKPPPPVVVQPPPPPPPRLGTAAKVLLVGGGLALATGAGFGVSGWLEARSLRRSCAPNCPTDDVDRVRLRLRIADVSLAVGVAALAGAGLLVWTRPDAPAAVAVAPLAGGGMVAVRFGATSPPPE